MITKYVYIILLGLLGMCINTSLAQSRFTLHHFGDNLAQTNMLNPAVMHKNKAVVGLPAISGVYFDFFNSGITLRDIFAYDGSFFKYISNLDSLGLSFRNKEALAGKLRNRHQLGINSEIQLLYLGVRVRKRHHFSLGVHTVIESRFEVPGPLASWALLESIRNYDITESQNVFSQNINATVMAYHQASASYAYNFLDKISIGVRVKYLLGIAAAHVQSPTGTIRLGTNNDIQIEAQAGKGYVSGVDYNAFSGNFNFFKAFNLLSTQNRGVAADLGILYNVSNRFSLSLSLLDLGVINWKQNTHTYEVQPFNYTYESESGFDESTFNNEINKIRDLSQFQEQTGQTFSTRLNAKMYLGANFRTFKQHTIRALFYGDLLHNNPNPAVSLAYNVPLGKIFSGTVGVSYRNRQIDNIGFGLSIKLGPLQIYAAADRMNPIYAPDKLAQGNIQAGINLVFNKHKKKEKKEEEPKEEEPKEEEPEEEEPKEEKVEVPKAPEKKPEPPKQEPTPLPAPKKIPTPKNYYVIVGAFELQENAMNYGRQLKEAGYDNTIEQLTAKNLYYVYLKKTDNNRTEAVLKLLEITNVEKFLFQEAWILSIEQTK